jgi:serine protease
MKTSQFRLTRIAAATLPLLFATATVNAADIPNLTQEPLFNQEQPTGPATRFIVTYKNQQTAALAGTVGIAAAGVTAQQARSHVESRLTTLAGEKLRHVRAMALNNRHVVRAERMMSKKETSQMIATLKQDPEVVSVEEDRMLRAFATPNDTQYSSQWHYFENTGGLRANTAWDSATGSGVVVAVLDTGFRPHADLKANLLPGYDMISDAFVGNDGGGRDSDASDPGDWTNAGECGNNYPPSNQGSSWHGTHVAGTIAAVTNNSSGVAGVAYNAKVVPVRVLGKCGGYTSDIADGIIWASGGTVSGVPANPNPAKVINMSLGGSGACDATTQAAINSARSRGTVVVIAAGNDNSNANNFNPGNCQGVINVAATNRSGGRAYYSNYGTSVDVAAPGGAMNSANDPNGVLSTYNTGTTTPGSDSYGYSQGTSMAAPHVAGVAALILQKKPNATPDEVESILKTTTRTFPATCTNCGTGIVDAAAAVAKAAGTGGGGGGTTPVPVTSKVTNISVARSAFKYYTVTVPAGRTNLTVNISGGTGDADLYVRRGAQPTTSTYDCRPYKSGSTESCSFTNPVAATYYIGIRGYTAVSGLTLTTSYQ